MRCTTIDNKVCFIRIMGIIYKNSLAVIIVWLQWNLSYLGGLVHTTVRISEMSMTKNSMLLC